MAVCLLVYCQIIYMPFDLNVIATGLAAPVAVLIARTLLDFSLAHVFVKWFWWVPVRGIFRDAPPSLSGNWEQRWEAAGSQDFVVDTDRHSHTTLRQFGRYCYAEYYSKGVLYCLFGKIQNSYLIGTWYDKQDKHAYFGAFQLRIVDGQTLEGKFVGHSKRNSLVQQDDWNWTKV